MSRYIDTKWLEDNAKEYSLGYYEEDEWATPLNVLDSAPSIDIVRCRECKYASDDGTYGCMCEHFNDTSDAYHRMWSDDFCSRGERNSSEKPNNCDTCKYGEDKHRYAHICNECGVGINNYEPKTFPTSSKMEQVDKDINVRSKERSSE